MTSYSSDLREPVKYQSVASHESRTVPGVRFAVRRPSLGQRIELARRARELALVHEFQKAGNEAEQAAATLAELAVEKTYLEWGLVEVIGLLIDGEPATVSHLIERGPEALSREIGEAILQEARLGEQERKNF